MPALMARLRDKDTQSARALYAIALSCLRSQEFVQMHTRELDLDAAQPTWTVPKERFKVDPHNHDFKVPLAPQFVRVLREQLDYLKAITGVTPYEGYLWPAVKEDSDSEWISDATMLRYLQRTMKVDATVHGFRASYKTWARGNFWRAPRPPRNTTTTPSSIVRRTPRPTTGDRPRIRIRATR